METPRLDRALGPLALVATALVFSGSLDNGFVNWDDYIYVHKNPLVTAPSSATLVERLTTPGLGYPVPLPVWFYGVLWSEPEAAGPFHALSLAVHLLNVGLLGHLLRRAEVTRRVAGVAMFAFACHPIVVEPVAWTTGLKDLLVSAGMLLAILGARRGWTAAPGALIAFASKPTSALLAAPLWASNWVDRRGAPGRAAWAAVFAVATLGVALALFTARQENEVLRTTLDRPFSIAHLLGALGLQLQHVVAPATLAPRYDPAQLTVIHLVLGAAAIVALCSLAIRWTRARDPRLPWLALATAAYLPVSNLRPLERFMADSYAYLPWMSIVACAALTWERRDARVSERARRLLRGLIVTACLSWAALTRAQVEAWSDSLNLWQDLYVTQPDNLEAIYFYGDALGRSGEADAEWALYRQHERALERGTRIPVLLPVYYARAGDPDRALAWYTRGFESPVRQADGLYWNYLDFVGAHPGHHPGVLDDALRYALIDSARQGTLASLPEAARENLVGPAMRLNLEAVARALQASKTDTPPPRSKPGEVP